MAPHQQRVVDEKTDLDLKIDALYNFFHGNIFDTLPADEQDRLSRQYSAMCEYSKILGERISAF